MEVRDLIVTPIVIFLVFGVAYLLRPYFTDSVTRRYFIPALVVRIAGALALGFIYQFYYDGGDTYNFHTHGSRHVWEALTEDPDKGVRLFMRDDDQRGLYKYSSKIPFYRDDSSFAIIRLATLFDLFTFSTYSATAICFAILGFIGSWLLFITFYQDYRHLHAPIAFATLFIPSIIFWGSGLLKDTVTLACLGVATFAVNKIFMKHKVTLFGVALLIVALYVLYEVKIYILLTFLPACIIWIFLSSLNSIRSVMLRVTLFPVILTCSVTLAYFAMLKAGEDNPKYSLSALSKTAQVTAYDIRYWTGREAGSGYALGELDGTWESMVRLAPQAINVSLFRPYLWEVNNPLMFFSSMESLVLLFLTIFLLFRARLVIWRRITKPVVLFCLIFSLVFAFAVGVSTYNFGTLTRYKIPLLPFYCIGLIILSYQEKSRRNDSAFDATEKF